MNKHVCYSVMRWFYSVRLKGEGEKEEKSGLLATTYFMIKNRDEEKKAVRTRNETRASHLFVVHCLLCFFFFFFMPNLNSLNGSVSTLNGIQNDFYKNNNNNEKQDFWMDHEKLHYLVCSQAPKNVKIIEL